jgi:hypothetical protein
MRLLRFARPEITSGAISKNELLFGGLVTEQLLGAAAIGVMHSGTAVQSTTLPGIGMITRGRQDLSAALRVGIIRSSRRRLMEVTCLLVIQNWQG